ncbi:FAS1 domain-containing protein [Tricladium varicosporioides]|nr:FAS1 domain-containing protein [Hymenoscyphus varicosporioides]
MKLSVLPTLLMLAVLGYCDNTSRKPLTYAAIPDGTYAPAKSPNVTTLLDFVKSRDDLTTLLSILSECAGFVQAFDTTASWSYTFFAPSNTAFNNTGAYFATYAATPKGKRWLGNLIQHHYVPNSQLKMSSFNTSYTRIQTGSFLYVGTQMVGGQLMLNKVSTVTSGDLPVTSGIVHVIDHILDPSAQIFEPEFGKTSQSFIAGSCSNPKLPYC